MRARPLGLTGRVFLVLAVTAAIAVGIWGLAAPRGAHQPLPAAIGDTVAVRGGLVRVVRVKDVSYETMPMSGPGMNMSAHAGVPKIPDGYRRFSVEVLLYADSGGSLQFAAPDFRVGRDGLKASAPLNGFGRALVPAGVALSRSLEFQVPQAAKGLALTVRGAERPILLSVPSAASAGHGHDHR